MEIRYPNYYGKFRCLAGACPDTCCGGWEISVDRASEKRCRRERRAAMRSGDPERKEFAGKLRRHVRGGRIVGGGKHCPFLDHGGLCEIYKELGEKFLCRTCRRHPRHVEDYGELHEVVLLLSCPEAARLILWENDGGYHVRKDAARSGNTDGIDGARLTALLAVRERIWDMRKNRMQSTSADRPETAFENQSWPADRLFFADRHMAQVLALCHDVQARLNRGEYEEIAEICRGGGTSRTAGPIFPAVRAAVSPSANAVGSTGVSPSANAVGPAGVSVPANAVGSTAAVRADASASASLTGLTLSVHPSSVPNSRFLLMADFMEYLAETDVICEEFMEELELCRKLLYHSPDSRKRYLSDRAAFAAAHPDLAAEWENLFHYFIYSFFLGALYDGDALGKAKLAVLCTMVVEDMDLAAWRRDGEIKHARQIAICHGLARQVENSDGNRGWLEQVVKKRQFSSRLLLAALAEDR